MPAAPSFVHPCPHVGFEIAVALLFSDAGIGSMLIFERTSKNSLIQDGQKKRRCSLRGQPVFPECSGSGSGMKSNSQKTFERTFENDRSDSQRQRAKTRALLTDSGTRCPGNCTPEWSKNPQQPPNQPPGPRMSSPLVCPVGETAAARDVDVFRQKIPVPNFHSLIQF